MIDHILGLTPGRTPHHPPVENIDWNCIVTVCDEISPEPEGNPEGGARGISRGLSRYYIVYPDSSHNTVILNFLTMDHSAITIAIAMGLAQTFLGFALGISLSLS